MYGGLGHRKFYLGEVSRIEERHRTSLPPGGYSPEQVEAGLDKLAANFGFYHTLRYMEKITPFKRTEILEWSVAEFKHALRYEAWSGHFTEKYHEVLKRKKM
jgi:hypothetical protein